VDVARTDLEDAHMKVLIELARNGGV